MSSPSRADAIRDYPHPIVCKPFVEKDGIVLISDKEYWVFLPWKDFVAIGKDRLLFKYLDGIFEIPHKGYVCDQWYSELSEYPPKK
jgi:hypothetical protein